MPDLPRLTGTHFYTWVHCRHAVAQDMARDRSERRELQDHERFARQRGLTLEADVVERLGAVRPEYPRGDFATGAAVTRELMLAGHPWIEQGVLHRARAGDVPEHVGLTDLLRRVPGASELGDFHYEPVDVKSSAEPRSDQILQVVFYAQLLGPVQGRQPRQGALILKDGRVEDFTVADFQPAHDAVYAGLLALARSTAAGGAVTSRPRHIHYCRRCHWSHLCGAELEAADDLSLVQGMTPGVQEALEAHGVGQAASLVSEPLARLAQRTRLEVPMLRRLRKAADARGRQEVLRQRRPTGLEEPVAVVHLLTDPFAERVLAFGARRMGGAGDALVHLPARADEEWDAFRALMAELPRRGEVLHYGSALPRWLERVGWNRADGREAIPGGESRLVDLARRLRGAVVFPGPVHGLEDQVRLGLGRDPDRAGAADAAAWWVDSDADGAPDRLRAKLLTDMEDLESLHRLLLDGDAAAGTMGSGTGGSGGRA